MEYNYRHINSKHPDTQAPIASPNLRFSKHFNPNSIGVKYSLIVLGRGRKHHDSFLTF